MTSRLLLIGACLPAGATLFRSSQVHHALLRRPLYLRVDQEGLHEINMRLVARNPRHTKLLQQVHELLTGEHVGVVAPDVHFQGVQFGIRQDGDNWRRICVEVDPILIVAYIEFLAKARTGESNPLRVNSPSN